jgi:hypothetical protein
MLESLSGRFPRFIWSDPTRPFADAPLRLESALRERIAPTALPTSSVIAAITAMAGYLRGHGEPRERALAAIRREVNAASHRDDGAEFSPEITDDIVRMAVDTCYGPAVVPDPTTAPVLREPPTMGRSPNAHATPRR